MSKHLPVCKHRQNFFSFGHNKEGLKCLSAYCLLFLCPIETISLHFLKVNIYNVRETVVTSTGVPSGKYTFSFWHGANCKYFHFLSLTVLQKIISRTNRDGKSTKGDTAEKKLDRGDLTLYCSIQMKKKN